MPERLIGADPDYFLRWTLDSWAGRPGAFDPRALAEYQRAFRDPDVIRATCEDYRAGATADVEDDAADRGMPAHPLSGPGPLGRGRVRARLGSDRHLAGLGPDVRGQGVRCGHFLPEEAPAETLAALEPFLAP